MAKQLVLDETGNDINNDMITMSPQDDVDPKKVRASWIREETEAARPAVHKDADADVLPSIMSESEEEDSSLADTSSSSVDTQMNESSSNPEDDVKEPEKAQKQASSNDPVMKLGPWGRDTKKENWGFLIPKAQRIKAITVTGSAVVDSLVFIVEDSNGNEAAIKIGGPGGTPFPEVEFGSGEYLKAITGAYGTYLNTVNVTSLTFITTKGTYGPYGDEKDRPNGATGIVKFALPMESEIAGFFGYADDYICCIGVYSRPAGADPLIKIGPWGRVAEDNWTFQIPTEPH